MYLHLEVKFYIIWKINVFILLFFITTNYYLVMTIKYQLFNIFTNTTRIVISFKLKSCHIKSDLKEKKRKKHSRKCELKKFVGFRTILTKFSWF
jgi:hypothetical protein